MVITRYHGDPSYCLELSFHLNIQCGNGILDLKRLAILYYIRA